MDALRRMLTSGNIAEQVDPRLFAEAVDAAIPVAKGPMQIGDMLSRYTPEEYGAMRTFLTPDRQSGYAIKDGDELVSVFSIPGGRGTALAQEAAARGARRLDNFDIEGKLPELYGRAGFDEVERYAYDPQYAAELSDYVNTVHPDVVMMNMNPAVAEALGRLRNPGVEDVRRIVAGGRGRITRNRRVQDAAAAGSAAAALAALIGKEDQ